MSGYSDIAGPLNEVFKLSIEKANASKYSGTDLVQLNLLNAIVAMYNKIKELTSIVNNIWQYELNEYKTDKQVAMLGNKGANLNKSAILQTERLANYATDTSKFIPQDQWKELPLEKKFCLDLNLVILINSPTQKPGRNFPWRRKLNFSRNQLNFELEEVKSYWKKLRKKMKF